MPSDYIILDKRFSTTRRLFTAPPLKNPKYVDLSYNHHRNKGGLRTKGYFKRTTKSTPLVSIITVVFNGEQYLSSTILSIINQDYDNIEYIIIDGGSTDKTLKIIQEYEEQIDFWISETDNGISDAFNKGIRLASGDLLMFLNADDFLLSTNSIQTAMLQIDHRYLLHWFRTGFITENGNKLYSFNYHFNKNSLYLRRTYPQPSMLYHSTVFDKIGLFDIKLKNTMDTELLIRAAVANVMIKSYEQIISVMRLGGISDKAIHQTILEGFIIRRKHIGLFYALIFTSFRWFKQKVKWILKSLLK
ncbi:glycosyltransferase family 2 protein [Porifericola rhodea]|uniref:glycosyltransferase family 2 protein n=1 Tax=Porifericola rhodea TaxID=930972 RepID=UPI002666D27B|nr:glycosyltransferase family 2 protein [Porifericola rhodea]WKN33476.1 glycosyltransferase family 2 protein [Porifericola rhodea]